MFERRFLEGVYYCFSDCLQFTIKVQLTSSAVQKCECFFSQSCKSWVNNFLLNSKAIKYSLDVKVSIWVPDFQVLTTTLLWCMLKHYLFARMLVQAFYTSLGDPRKKWGRSILHMHCLWCQLRLFTIKQELFCEWRCI